MNKSSRICAGAKKRNRTSTGVTPLEPESKGQFPSKQEQGKNRQECGSQGGQPQSPETIQGQRPKGNPKDGRTRDQFATTPEQDRAVILRALKVMRSWDSPTRTSDFVSDVESLRAALAAAGYLDTTGGPNG